jgi:3-phenylpropionate/cinnamic acid dioxygenase small subunit
MTAPNEHIAEQHAERECTRFLDREAELLDNWQFNEWLELISTVIDYRVPVCTTCEKNHGSGFRTKAFFMEEDYSSLKTRVSRLGSDFAWSQNPHRAGSGRGAERCQQRCHLLPPRRLRGAAGADL